MKKSNIILTIVAVVLILGVCFSVFSILSSIDDTIDKVENPSGTTGTGGNGGNSSKYPSFYCLTKSGYITEGNVTTFFVIVNPPSVGSLNNYEDTAYSCGFPYDIYFYPSDLTLYRNTSYFSKISLDRGLTWQDMNERTDSEGNFFYSSASISGQGEGVQAYLGYSQIENCTNPINYLYEIESYLGNALLKECSGCNGTYYAYSSFNFHVTHTAFVG